MCDFLINNRGSRVRLIIKMVENLEVITEEQCGGTYSGYICYNFNFCPIIPFGSAGEITCSNLLPGDYYDLLNDNGEVTSQRYGCRVNNFRF